MAVVPVQWRVQAQMILAAGLGGGAFTLAGIPAGWLSGAMVALAMVCAMKRAEPLADPLRNLAMIASGTAIGSAMTPQVLHGLGRYPATLALMVLAMLAITFINTAILCRVPGFSRQTAFFASVPGALSYVFAVSATTQADMARIAVVQVLRTFFLMAVLPLVVAESGVQLAAVSVQPFDPLWLVVLVFALGTLAGAVLERLNVAGGMLFGAMLASGLLHVTGLAPGRLPAIVAIVGQLMVGAWTGARFVGFDWRLLGRLAFVSLGCFALTMAVAAGFAAVAAFGFDIPFSRALLAFAPGGLEAMTILAFTLGIDPLFVGVHHLARFVMISTSLPFIARFWFAPSLGGDGKPGP